MNLTKLKKVENRKLHAGYSIKIWRDGSGDITLLKGKDSWSDVVRAMSHLTSEIDEQRREIIEEIVIRLHLLQANLPLTVSDPSYARKQIKLTINELGSLKQK